MSRLNLPVTLFASTMGLGGLGLVYSRLSLHLGWPSVIGAGLRWLDTVIFVLLALIFIRRLLFRRAEVKAEFNHPLKLNFFAAIPISMFLLAALWGDHPLVHTILYYPALIFITVFTVVVAALWFSRHLELKFLNPAWFIPVVGNVIAVFTAAELRTYLWYYFAVGVTFYLVLLTLIMFRLIFAEPLPPPIKPTLFIFMAPPSLCFIDYVLLSGFDPMAAILLSLTVFFTLLMLVLSREFFHVPFTPSWWAFTFPVATVGSAFISASEVLREPLFLHAAVVVFLILCALVAITFWRTVRAIAAGTLTAPPPAS